MVIIEKPVVYNQRIKAEVTRALKSKLSQVILKQSFQTMEETEITFF